MQDIEEEPEVYKVDRYGIRLENNMGVRKCRTKRRITTNV